MKASLCAARLCVLIWLAAVAGSASAQTAPPAKPEPTPVLVELFTSEGCNSCPPADELLRKLDGMATVTGQTILALSEHVTYWNRLGWVDPFSNEVFTERQNTYGENFNMEEIYTPMVVVNGSQAVLGSDRAAVLAAVSFQALPLPVGIQVLSARASGGNLFVAYMLSGKLPAGGGEVYAALVDDLETMQVAHGENAGRTLSHVSVVRSFRKGAMLKAGEQSILTLVLPVAPAVANAPGQHLVVFAQVAGQGRVIGMVRQPVSAPFPTTDAKPVAAARRTLGTR
jgi:hypothetical protein